MSLPPPPAGKHHAIVIGWAGEPRRGYPVAPAGGS